MMYLSFSGLAVAAAQLQGNFRSMDQLEAASGASMRRSYVSSPVVGQPAMNYPTRSVSSPVHVGKPAMSYSRRQSSPAIIGNFGTMDQLKVASGASMRRNYVSSPEQPAMNYPTRSVSSPVHVGQPATSYSRRQSSPAIIGNFGSMDQLEAASGASMRRNYVSSPEQPAMNYATRSVSSPVHVEQPATSYSRRQSSPAIIDDFGSMGQLEAASGGTANFQHQPMFDEMEHMVDNNGPMNENTKEDTQIQTKTIVTHHPVYYKTYLDHYTQHDQVNEDVYHHIGEEELRYFDVEGRTTTGFKQDIDHGKIGHAAYGSIVGEYGVQGQRMAGRNLLGRSYASSPMMGGGSAMSFQRRSTVMNDEFGAMGAYEAASGGGSKFQHQPLLDEMEYMVDYEGPMNENTKEDRQIQTKTIVTHHPVYYKTYLDHYTQHDQVNEDVYHHIGEEEMRYFDIEGSVMTGPKQDIDHGKIGHAAYGSIVEEYGVQGQRMAGRNLLGYGGGAGYRRS